MSKWLLELLPPEQIYLVNGYPKSGNSWITGIIMDILNTDYYDFFLTGEESTDSKITDILSSDFPVVFKGHYPEKIISHYIHMGFLKENHVVNVVRDVRDVIVSGAHFFNYPIKRFPIARFFPFVKQRKLGISGMEKAVLEGDLRIPWLEHSWSQYMQAFLHKGYKIYRYEDILADTEKHIADIAYFLEIDIASDCITEIAEKRSFKTMKKSANYSDRLLRKGKKGDWRNHLSNDQLSRIYHSCSEVMNALDYPIEYV